MMWIKRLYLKSSIVLLLIITLQVVAQQSEVVHAIAKGETLSGLAKEYHTTVGDIMRLNGMDSKSVLRIGQKVKIPSKSAKLNTTAQRNAPVARRTVTNPVVTETPVEKQEPSSTESTATHIVGKKETLYGISKMYKVTVDQIKGWNHLTSNSIHEGQRLSINGNSQIQSDVVTSHKEAAEPVSDVQPEPKAATTSQKNSQPEANAGKNNEDKTPSASPKVINTVKQKDPEDSKNSNDAGYFGVLYHQGQQELTGDAATFKTASGWVDKKYYILVNKIDAGTIVRITANNKIIYAKVLGPLPEIKEDNGLLLRLSNSAASVLGLADSKFPVVVNY